MKFRVLSFVTVLFAFSQADAQDILKWKLQTGEQLRYQVAQTNKTGMKVAGLPAQETTLQQAMDMFWKVKNVSGGGAVKMDQTINRVRMNVESPMGKFAYDTKELSEPQEPQLKAMATSLSAIVQKNFEVDMAANGKVTNVRVPEEVLAAIKESAAGNQNAVNDETIKEMMKQSPVTLPPGPVSPGAKWQSDKSINLGFVRMVITSDMTYKSKDSNGNAVIDVVPTIQLIPNEAAPMQVTLQSSSGKGQLLFDVERGRISRSELDLSMEMKVVANSGQSIQQTMKTKMVMTLVP